MFEKNPALICAWEVFLHPDRTKAPPLRNLSIARELTLASLRICGEIHDRCERPQKHRKLEYGMVLRVSGRGGVKAASFTCNKEEYGKRINLRQSNSNF